MGAKNKGYIHYTVNKTQFQNTKTDMAELKFWKNRDV